MKERDIVEKIKDYLESQGATIFKHYGSPYSTKGFPDLFGFLADGRFIAIEVKQPGQMPTLNQLAMIEFINRRGGIAFWADSVGVVKAKLSP